MTPRRALLAGATGLVGRGCLAALAAADEYEHVVTPVRRTLAAPHPKVHVLEGAFRDGVSLPDFPPVDDVFCCLGTTMRNAGSREAFRQVDLELPLALARATRARGARQFLFVSSVGADSASRTFYLRVKGETEAGLAEIGFDALLVFRPSFLLGDRDEWRAGEVVAKALAPIVTPLLRGSLKRYRPIPAAIVAQAMVAAALAGHHGVHVFHFDQIVEIGRSFGTI